MQYPRPGEAIAPRLLRPLVMDRRPATRLDPDSDMVSRLDLGPDAWNRLSPETCRRLSMLVVDRVQTRVHTLPDLARTRVLPEPHAALKLPIERRTANTIRRGLRYKSSGPWTVERYLGLPRFGGRALVDLLAAVEAQEGEGSSREASAGARTLDETLKLIAHRLPISEEQAQAELVQEGLATGSADLGELVRTAVKLGHDAPFHIIDVAGSRMIVRLSDVSAARAAYRIAMRVVQGLGTATIRAVASQLHVVVHAVVGLTFVEKILVGVRAFRWLDRRNGWFWFDKGRNPLVEDLRKVFSVASRLPLGKVRAALFRTRRGPCPSPEAIQQLCTAIPGIRVVGGIVTIDRRLDRAAHLSGTEDRFASLLETSPGGMPDSQIRNMVRSTGLPWTPVLRLLRSSPVVEQSANGFYRLIGSAG